MITDVSNKSAARQQVPPKRCLNIYQMTWRHNPKEWNFKYYCCFKNEWSSLQPSDFAETGWKQPWNRGNILSQNACHNVPKCPVSVLSIYSCIDVETSV